MSGSWLVPAVSVPPACRSPSGAVGASLETVSPLLREALQRQRAAFGRRAVGHVRGGVEHHADHRSGDRQRRGAPDELPPADDAVDAGLDQAIDGVEVGGPVAVAIRTGNEIDHCAFLLLAVSPVWWVSAAG